MKLSRALPAASAAPKPVSLPDASRLTPKIGCAVSRKVRWRSDNSPITESNRNGMSSLTISITEIDLRSPEPSSGTVSKRTFGVPGLRSLRNAQARSPSMARSLAP